MTVKTGNHKGDAHVKLGGIVDGIAHFKKLSQRCHHEPICIFAVIPSTSSWQFSCHPERSKRPGPVLEHREGSTDCRTRISKWSLSTKARNTEFVFSESFSKPTKSIYGFKKSLCVLWEAIAKSAREQPESKAG